MATLTGYVSERLIRVENQVCWSNLELTACIVVGGPTVRFGKFENVTFMNCVFLYDGMEVDGREWLEFMSREHKIGPARIPRRGAGGQ